MEICVAVCCILPITLEEANPLGVSQCPHWTYYQRFHSPIGIWNHTENSNNEDLKSNFYVIKNKLFYNSNYYNYYYHNNI